MNGKVRKTAKESRKFTGLQKKIGGKERGDKVRGRELGGGNGDGDGDGGGRRIGGSVENTRGHIPTYI